MQYQKQTVKTQFKHPETGKPLNKVVIDGVAYGWNSVFKVYNSQVDYSQLQIQIEVPNIDYERSK